MARNQRGPLRAVKGLPADQVCPKGGEKHSIGSAAMSAPSIEYALSGAGVVAGRLVAGEDSAVPLRVEYPGNPDPNALEPRAIVKMHASDAGREVLLAFEQGDPRCPVVLGFLDARERTEQAEEPPAQSPIDFEADGERVTITANREIVLRCGQGRITIRKNGDIVVRGSRLLSRSSGVNRIKGATVRIN